MNNISQILRLVIVFRMIDILNLIAPCTLPFQQIMQYLTQLQDDDFHTQLQDNAIGMIVACRYLL